MKFISCNPKMEFSFETTFGNSSANIYCSSWEFERNFHKLKLTFANFCFAFK